MAIRSVSAILLGGIALAAFAALPAEAAVTVLGNGIARACYEAAEFGGDAHDGIAECSLALDEAAIRTARWTITTTAWNSDPISARAMSTAGP